MTIFIRTVIKSNSSRHRNISDHHKIPQLRKDNKVISLVVFVHSSDPFAQTLASCGRRFYLLGIKFWVWDVLLSYPLHVSRWNVILWVEEHEIQSYQGTVGYSSHSKRIYLIIRLCDVGKNELQNLRPKFKINIHFRKIITCSIFQSCDK